MSKYIESGQPVDKNNFKGSDPKEEGFTSENGPVKYYDQKLFYNYGTTEEPIVQDVLLEGPPMKFQELRIRDEGMKKSRKGNDYHKVTTSMICVFDLADNDTKDECKKSLEYFREAYLGCALALGQHKGKVNMHHFNPDQPDGTLNNFVYWPTDNNGIIPGRNPSVWANFKSYGPNKTLITDLNGKPIGWDLLKESDGVIVPLFHLESNFVGSVKKVKVNLKSGIVVKIVPTASETCQTSTIDRLKAKYGSGKADEVEAQLAELRLAKQEVLETHEGTMHNVEPQEQQPQESLQDFLGGAPSMPNALPKVTTLKIN